MLSWIFAGYQVLAERADGEGAFLRLRGAPAIVEELRTQLGPVPAEIATP